MGHSQKHTKNRLLTEKIGKTLRSFHNHALRHMIGRHIIKKDGETWQCPCYMNLQWQGGLFSLETDIERKREILKKYLEEHKRDLLEE